MSIESQAALAKLAADTKAVCATSADVTKAALAKSTTAKATTTGLGYHAKAAILAHSFYLTAAGGFVVGIAACYLANKYWLNKNTAEQTTLK